MTKLKSKCHCGAVELELNLPNGIGPVRRCNCSMCCRRGAIVSSIELKDLKVVKGESLKTYQFGTMTAKHFFCSNCGIYTHHQRRSNPLEYSFNLACTEGFVLEDYPVVPITNGRHHVKDQKN